MKLSENKRTKALIIVRQQEGELLNIVEVRYHFLILYLRANG